MTDPQQLNSYSYGRNNPYTYRDVNGKKAEIVYRPISKPYDGIGAHVFILVTPNAGEKTLSISGYEGQQKVTIGGYPTGGNFSVIDGSLNADINHATDFNLSDSDYLARETITPPEGMSVENYDRFIVKVGEVAKKRDQGVLDKRYGFLGRNVIGSFAAPNSNNAATQIINSSGGSFTPNSKPSGRWAPGIGIPVYSQKQHSLITSFMSAFTPTNPTQAQAVLNVIAAFGLKK